MDTTTQILAGLLFGSVGMGYIVYGRKQLNAMALLAGIGLCVFPYFVASVWLMMAIGLALVLLPFVIRL